MTTMQQLSTAGKHDFLRDTLCQFGPGKFVITDGVAALEEDEKQSVIGRMIEFRFWTREKALTEPGHEIKTPALVYVAPGVEPLANGTEHYGDDSDPYGEHDFGSFDHEDVKYFWKFDEFPDGPVLTLMRADEY